MENRMLLLDLLGTLQVLWEEKILMSSLRWLFKIRRFCFREYLKVHSKSPPWCFLVKAHTCTCTPSDFRARWHPLILPQEICSISYETLLPLKSSFCVSNCILCIYVASCLDCTWYICSIRRKVDVCGSSLMIWERRKDGELHIDVCSGTY